MHHRDVPTRLLSPIRIPDLVSRPPPSSVSSPICSPIKRRRAHNNLFHQFTHAYPRSPISPSPIRPRHCKKSDCCIVPSPLSANPFNDLPWISLLEQYPSPTVCSPYESPISPWDLPDLDAERPEKQRHSGGPGPIRSRKSSARLRCVPFSTVDFPCAPTPPPISAIPELSPSKLFEEEVLDDDDTSLLEVPTHVRARTWSGSSEDSEPPRTPPPRAAVLPALVDFRNLMPVSLSDEEDAEEDPSWAQ